MKNYSLNAVWKCERYSGKILMTDLTKNIKDILMQSGADMVAFGDMTEFPERTRMGLPVGISVAVKYPKDVIKGISVMPTREYYDQYNLINNKLDMVVSAGAKELQNLGYNAIAQTMEFVSTSETDFTTILPHKSVATRAGLGWIGKSALLVTKKYGSMIRLSSVLTDAPLELSEPINNSQCGECMACTNACPGKAILGINWSAGLKRDVFYNAYACRETARERSLKSFGINISQCGKCIEVCPYTRKYLYGEENEN